MRLQGLPLVADEDFLFLVAVLRLAVPYTGLILTARLGVAAPMAASGYELDIIAAAVIGGAMLSHTAGGSLAGFEAVGLLSCLFALASLWTAFKIRTVS